MNHTLFLSDALVLYDDVLFNGKRVVIREDTSDLGSFANKASSFKILGESLWMMHQYVNYHGKSVVLTKGDFPSMDVLPFGDNALESARRVPSRDQSRIDISNYNGQGMFHLIKPDFGFNLWIEFTFLTTVLETMVFLGIACGNY